VASLIFSEVKMLSLIPIDPAKLPKGIVDKELLRVAIIGELDAINLYEQMAAITQNKDLKAVFADVAKEEKTHVGEFQALLLRMDKEQVDELAHGKKEVDELTA
jgi:rubrerythrin